MEKKEEEEQITPEEIQFFNIMAMSNFGSFILIVSDQCIQALMTILAVFHNTTENDVIIHILFEVKTFLRIFKYMTMIYLM